MMRWLTGICVALLGLVILSGCSTAPVLSNVSLSATTLTPSGAEESVSLSYTIGQTALVSVALDDAKGTH